MSAAARVSTGRRRAPDLRAGAAALAALAAGAWVLAAEPRNEGAAAANLVRNGGFEAADAADPARPAHWERTDGLGIIWTNAAGAAGRGRAICMDTAVSEQALNARRRERGIAGWDIPQAGAGPVAAAYGLSYYSDPVPVASAQTYRVTFDFMGAAGGKVWVRCTGDLNGEKRRLYETVVPCAATAGGWRSFSHEFNPTKHRPRVTEMRVMLYAYWPAGKYWFDNVSVQPVAGGPAARPEVNSGR